MRFTNMNLVGLLSILWLISACGAPQTPAGSTAQPTDLPLSARIVAVSPVLPTVSAGSDPTPLAERIVVGAGSYQRVQAAQLVDMLKQKDFVLVNTHIPYAGEIAATDLFLPYDQIDQQLGQLPADKQAKIVLYCRTGHMSAIAAEVLVKAGYTNVWDLQGGMVAWKAVGQPVISKEG